MNSVKLAQGPVPGLGSDFLTLVAFLIGSFALAAAVAVVVGLVKGRRPASIILFATVGAFLGLLFGLVAGQCLGYYSYRYLQMDELVWYVVGWGLPPLGSFLGGLGGYYWRVSKPER